jgi:DNA-nicking Smr family endonuclease
VGRFKSRKGPDGRPAKGMRRSIRMDAFGEEERPHPSGEPPESIHLRQMRADAALAKLEMMVDLHRRRGTDELLVVHGKGLRSQGGQPVIGPLVLRWCEENHQRILSWREAPRDWGGQGAIVIRLRKGQA